MLIEVCLVHGMLYMTQISLDASQKLSASIRIGRRVLLFKSNFDGAQVFGLLKCRNNMLSSLSWTARSVDT